MSPRQISERHADVMEAHHRRVALDTHSRLVAAATAFGGKKEKIYDPFIERLTETTDRNQPEKRTISMAELAAMGKMLMAEQADEPEEKRLEREAEDAAMRKLFEKHQQKALPA